MSLRGPDVRIRDHPVEMGVSFEPSNIIKEKVTDVVQR